MPGGTAVVTLNGLPYVARMPIQHFQIQQQTDPFRTTGAFLRTNNPKLEPYPFNDWSGGFGVRFIRPGHPEDKRHFFNATVATLHKAGITLPLAQTSIVLTPNTSAIRGSATFKNELWGLMRPVDNDSVQSVVIARRISGTTWGGGGDVLQEAANTSKLEAYDLLAAGDKLYAIIGTVNDHVLRYSSDGVTWTAPATTAPPINLFTAFNDMLAAFDDGARLAFDGIQVILCLWDQAGGKIVIKVSTDGGDTWANPAGGAIAIQTGDGVRGAKMYLDTDGSSQLHVGLVEGVWLVDLAAGSADKLLELPHRANSFNCMRMEVHNGSLYIPVDNGDDSPFGMKKITVTSSARIIEDVGLDITQDIPVAMLGKVTWMKSIGPFLFVAIGGNSDSRQATIIAITGLPGEGWQHVFQASAVNRRVIWIDGEALDLYLGEKGDDQATGTAFSRNTNQLSPPTSGVTFIYDNDSGKGNLELPEFGGDAPEEDGAFFQVQADAAKLVDGAEFLDFEYGLNGADPTTDDSDRIDGTNRKQNLGASDRGLSARTIRQNIEFNRGGDSSLSPLLREWVLLSRKKVEELHGYEFDIDAEATERSYGRGQDQIRDELLILRRQSTLFEFIESDDEGAVQVEMPTFNDADWVTAGAGSQSKSQLEGLIRVRLEEILQHSG